jgi:hypothetical protein
MADETDEPIDLDSNSEQEIPFENQEAESSTIAAVNQGVNNSGLGGGVSAEPESGQGTTASRTDAKRERNVNLPNRSNYLIAACLVALVLVSSFSLYFIINGSPEVTMATVAPPLIILFLTTLTLIYQVWTAFQWRQSLIKSGSVALVPEKWGMVLQRLSVEHGRAAEVMAAEGRMILDSTEAVHNLSETVMTFKVAIEQRDAEIKQLRTGYDYSILKGYFGKLVRLNDLADELAAERADDGDIDFLRRSVAAILQDCNLESVSPQIGSDVREAGRLIDDNVKFESTDDPELAHHICEVLSLAYVFDPEGANQIIKPAKVVVYKYGVSEEKVA